MTRHIDQVPQPKPYYAPPTGGHPESIDGRNSQTGFGQDNIPANEYEGLPEISRHHNISKRTKFTAALTLGAIASTAALLGGGYYLYEQKTKDIWNDGINDANDQSRNNSGVTFDPETNTAVIPTDLDPASVNAETFENSLSRVHQMDYAGPKLNSSLQEDREAIIAQLDEMGWGDYNYFNREVVEPSIDNTPQEIWDQITLGQFKSWKTAQEGDIEEAKKLATAVVEGQEYDEFTTILGNGGAPVVPVGAAEAILPAKSSGNYTGVDANGLGVIEFKKTTVYDGDQVRVIARLTQGNDDKSLRWVLVKTLPMS